MWLSFSLSQSILLLSSATLAIPVFYNLLAVGFTFRSFLHGGNGIINWDLVILKSLGRAWYLALVEGGGCFLLLCRFR